MLMRRADLVPHLPKYFRQVADVVLCQHATTRFGHEDQLGVQSVNDAPATPVVTTSCHRRMACSDAVLVRYRYRLRPMPGQQQALAQVFGCARVVFNDSLRLREECHEAGEKVSDTEIQRRVIALAKPPPSGRGWRKPPRVPLVQACNDARRAYRNWFDSLSGKRKGRKVAHPRFRRQRGRQSIRLTRNGFRLRGQRLYVAKVGDIKVRWSRPLPGAVVGDGDPRGGWPVLRLVRRGAGAVPLAAGGVRQGSMSVWTGWPSPRTVRSSPTRVFCGPGNGRLARDAAGTVPQG